MNDFYTFINMFGLVVLGLAYIFVQWRTGGNKASIEVINAYKEQLTLTTNKVNELTKDLGEMRGQMVEKDKRIVLLESLVQGRNPEQEEFMKYMMQMAQSGAKYMKDSSDALLEVKTYIHKLNGKLDMVLVNKVSKRSKKTS